MTDQEWQAYIDSIQKQEVTWKELGYTKFLHRVTTTAINNNSFSPDSLDMLIESGALSSSVLGSLILGDVIKSLSANKITTGTLDVNTAIMVGEGIVIGNPNAV